MRFSLDILPGIAESEGRVCHRSGVFSCTQNLKPSVHLVSLVAGTLKGGLAASAFGRMRTMPKHGEKVVGRGYCVECENCGKLAVKPNVGARFCGRACWSAFSQGEYAPNWQGGLAWKKKNDGYMVRTCRGHHRATSQNRVYDHILIVEQAMGKPLRRTAEVHHVNENKEDNRNCNLVVCHDDAYHKLLHAKRRRILAAGDLNHKKCCRCGRVLLLKDF